MPTKPTRTDTARRHDEGKSVRGSKAGVVDNGHLVSVEHAGHAVREGIVGSLSGLSTIEADIAMLVRKTVSDTLRTGGSAAGELVGVVQHVVTGAIEATEQVGTGLTMSTRSVAKGIVMGVHDVGGDVVTASFETLRSIIKHAAAAGADIGVVARQSVDGVIEATAETGGNIAEVGRKAIEGAIEEAGNVGNMAVRTVKDVLIGIAASLGETIGAALPHGATEQLPPHAAKKPRHH